MEQLRQAVTRLSIDSDMMADSTIQEAVRLYKKMRDFKEDVEAQINLLTEKIDNCRQVVLPLMYKENNITSITVDGYRFTISQTVRASIPADTKPQAYQWLRDNDLADLIIETVNASTLASQARKMLEDGEGELPEPLFKVALVPNVSITKAT